MVQGVGEAHGPGQAQVDVARVAPLGHGRVERLGRGVDGPAQGPEQALGEARATAAGQRGDVDLERDRGVRERLPGVAAACHRRPEHRAERDREHRGGGVGAVVDVLGERERVASAEPLVAHDPHGVDLEEQRDRAARGVGLGIEDVRRADGKVERLGSGGVLVQQVPEVGRVQKGSVLDGPGRRAGGRREGDQHAVHAPTGTQRI
ncbi:hypothetical protein D3C74_337660 [compost metagenome]